MNTFLIFTAPPGYFVGGISHDSSDSEEDLIVSTEYTGGARYEMSTYSDEEYVDNDPDLEDVFGGQPLYVDYANIGETALDNLIQDNYQPEGYVAEQFDGLFEGGLTMRPEDFDGLFDQE